MLCLLVSLLEWAKCFKCGSELFKVTVNGEIYCAQCSTKFELDLARIKRPTPPIKPGKPGKPRIPPHPDVPGTFEI